MKEKVNRYKALAAMLLGATMLAACSQEQLTGSESPDRLPVRLSVATDRSMAGQASTRASSDIRNVRFAMGERFEAYFGTNVSSVSVASTYYTITGIGVNSNDADPDTQPFVKKGSSGNNKVQCYYPSKSAIGTGTFTVSDHQETESNYNASDLLYAEGTVSGVDGVAETDTGTRTLVFSHRLGCIVVNLTVYSDLLVKKVLVVAGQRSIDISDAETFTLATWANTSVPITHEHPLTMYDSSTGQSNVSCSAMLPAQIISKGIEALLVETDKGNVYFMVNPLGNDLIVAGGHRYILNLNLTHADLGTTCTIGIKSWDPDGTIELTRGEDGSFDVDGVLFRMIEVDPSGSSLSGYWLGETEVTNELWNTVQGSKPSGQSNNGDQAPVSNFTYAQAETFVTNLNTKTALQRNGWKFAIPTLEQWKWAANGGAYNHGYVYSGTSDNLNYYAWHAGNSSSKSQEVTTKVANEIGFYDMTGNVCEWVSTTGANGQHLAVGGHYGCDATSSDLLNDYWTTSMNGSDAASANKGLRLAMIPE